MAERREPGFYWLQRLSPVARAPNPTIGYYDEHNSWSFVGSDWLVDEDDEDLGFMDAFEILGPVQPHG